ncbi:hypothetical protein [Klebsiella quasivariicola]|uniref:hypothetical protein n=1 Tax=Klebsiella quasivariicola TaxID=2026240 RepID=UPI0024787943|nr:hypothetical protein [Klebsiella quasivariicola]
MEKTATPDLIAVPFANNGVKNNIPVESQIDITDGAASFNDGFPPLTMTPVVSGGVPPFGQDFNGILNAITSSIRWACAGGLYSYNSDFATSIGGYPAGAMLLGSDTSSLWMNISDNNTGDIGGGNWMPVFSYGVSNIYPLSDDITLTPLQAAKPIILLSGKLKNNLTIYFPAWARQWLVINNTSGIYNVSIKTPTGNGINLTYSGASEIYCDGKDIFYGSLMAKNNLAEISAQGTSAKGEACNNIGALSTSGGTIDGDVHVSSGHAFYFKSPISLDKDNPGAVNSGDFVSTPVVKFRLLERGGLDDPEGAYAEIHYEECVGSYNAISIGINGFNGRAVLKLINSGNGDQTQSQLQVPGSLNTGGLLYEVGQRVYSPNNPQPFPGSGNVDSYALAGYAHNANFNFGDTVDGGTLFTAGVSSCWNDNNNRASLWSGGALSGTWMCMGHMGANSASDYGAVTLWKRIA